MPNNGGEVKKDKEVKANGSKVMRRPWKCPIYKLSTTSPGLLATHMIAVHWDENWNFKISVKITEVQQQLGGKALEFEEAKVRPRRRCQRTLETWT